MALACGFERSNEVPFGIDIRGTEKLVVIAGAGNDTVTATGNLAGLIQLTIIGGDGIDTIRGDNGNDILLGGADNDALIGSAGNDTLDGGTGTDAVVGGIGNDTYVVTDFSTPSPRRPTKASIRCRVPSKTSISARMSRISR